MANELAGKVAIITGGARGLGQGMSELFIEEGAKVVIADLRDEEGEALAKALGSNAIYRRCDISSRDEFQALADFTVSQFGGLNALVNNAGLTDNLFGTLMDADFSVFEKIMAVNVKGTMQGTQIAARHMARYGGGSIINISSISGIQPGFGFFTYRASKAAVVNFTKSAAIELGPNLIRVNCICPGNIPTEMAGYAQGDDPEKTRRIREAIAEVRMGYQPLKRQGGPRDIAEAALWFAGDRSAQVTGQIMAVDAGATAGSPFSQIADIMAARAKAEAE